MNSRAKSRGIVNEKTLRVGVDMGKMSFTWYWRSPDRRESKVAAVNNTKEGFESLLMGIETAKTAHGLTDVVVAFEPTGSYAEPLAMYLNRKGVRLVQINPKHTKHLKEVRDNSPNKTDFKDPKLIVDILEVFGGLSVIQPEGVYAALRELTGFREQLLKRRCALINQAHELMAVVFPECAQLLKSLTGKTALYIMKTYPLPQMMARRTQEKLYGELRTASRGRFSAEKARALHQASKNSCGVVQGSQEKALSMRIIVRDIARLNDDIEAVEKRMERNLEDVPYGKIIMSMKGIKTITAAGIIGETGDLRNYHKQAELWKLCGLNLFELSSGKHQGQRHISKRGRAVLRRLLFFASLNTIREGGAFHAAYTRYIGTGKPRIKGIIMVCRKLLATLFAMARDMKEYEHGRNQEPTAA